MGPLMLQALLILPELIVNGSNAIMNVANMIRTAKHEGRDITPDELAFVARARAESVARFEQAYVAAGGQPLPQPQSLGITNYQTSPAPQPRQGTWPAGSTAIGTPTR